jgi:hypothetical protein
MIEALPEGTGDEAIATAWKTDVEKRLTPQ